MLVALRSLQLCWRAQGARLDSWFQLGRGCRVGSASGLTDPFVTPYRYETYIPVSFGAVSQKGDGKCTPQGSLVASEKAGRSRAWRPSAGDVLHLVIVGSGYIPNATVVER